MSKNEKGLVPIHGAIKKLLIDKSGALPEGLNQTRFLQNCMTVLQDTKGIENMTPPSVARTMLKGAFLGLDFFTRECYAIPYGNSLQFQTDYKGEIKLAKKYSSKPIQDIYAKIVRKGDVFVDSVKNGKQSVDFTPLPFNDGDIIGVFAVCLYDDQAMIYETMTKKEVENVRDAYSKQANGSAWKKSFGEMMKKTVLRRLCKLIEIEFKTSEQDESFSDGSHVDVMRDDLVGDGQDIKERLANSVKAKAEVIDEKNGKPAVKKEPEKPKDTPAVDDTLEKEAFFAEWKGTTHDDRIDSYMKSREELSKSGVKFSINMCLSIVSAQASVSAFSDLKNDEKLAISVLWDMEQMKGGL